MEVCLQRNESAYLWLILGVVIYSPQYTDGVLDGTPLECATHDDARDYMGTDPITKSGKDCQVWTEQSPKQHEYTRVELFPDSTIADAVNYCRNPIHYQNNQPDQKTWCYPMTGFSRWEWCAFPERCSDCKDDMVGSSYSGTVSSTSCGITCQRWDSQSPHPHTYTEHTYFPDSTLQFAENYCRNPDDARAAPWCYTTDAAVEWEYCNVDLCENPEGGSLCGVDLEPQETTVRVRETTIPLTEPLETTTAEETTVPTTTTERETTTPEPLNETTEPAGEASELVEGVTGPMVEVTDAVRGSTQQLGELATDSVGGATQHGALVTEPAEMASQSGGLVSELAVGATQHGGLVSALNGEATEQVYGMSQTEALDNREHVFNGTNALGPGTSSTQDTTGDAVGTEAPEPVSQRTIVTDVPYIQQTGKVTHDGNVSDLNQTDNDKDNEITRDFDRHTTTIEHTTVPKTSRSSTKAATMVGTTDIGSVKTDNVYDEDYYEAEKAEENDLLPIYLVVGAVAFELSIAIPCFIMYFKKTGTIKSMEA